MGKYAYNTHMHILSTLYMREICGVHGTIAMTSYNTTPFPPHSGLVHDMHGWIHTRCMVKMCGCIMGYGNNIDVDIVTVRVKV